MASLTAELTTIDTGPPAERGGAVHRWSLLNRLHYASRCARDGDGTIRLARADAAGCFLFGPYYHFEMGRYRLSVRASAGVPALTDQPVLGVEIIILSRFQRGWRDFTAAELAAGAGTLVFDVPPELSIDGGNEARFEFRVFHFGNADIGVSAIELERLPDDTAVPPDARVWRLLGRLRKSWLGRRGKSGEVTVGQGWPAGCLLYGGWPYLRLGRGQYRLTIRGAAGVPRLLAQPVLGVEILGRSRWYSDSPRYEWGRLPKPGGTREAWGDFRADELADGAASIDFAVPIAMATEAGADAPFDIRLHHLGNADLTVTAVDLRWLGEEEATAVPPNRWRLLGRMRKARIGTDSQAGVSVSADEVPGTLLSAVKPPLRLSAGHYRLNLHGSAQPQTAASLRVDVTERTGLGWRPQPHFRQDLASGGVAEFDVPQPEDAEVGDRRYDLSVSHLGGADVTLAGIELTRDPSSDRGSPAYLAGRKKLVLIGNCQCSVLVQAFNQTDSLSRNYVAKYHFVQLKPNLHEFARRDIEDCDVLLVQDIELWNQFPLRDCVRPGTDIVKFPLMRFASLWPFDGWNGPGDHEAFLAEAPNHTFPFLDGLLARLRHQIPDKAARFEAYRTLEGIAVVNYARIHALEERRLLKIDKQYDCRIGEFTLENFRTRQVFHTTVRPNWQGFNLLLRMILRAIGERNPVDPLSQGADAHLRIPQVPVHPKVAADLGVKWADEKTRYQVLGEVMNWETYIRRYIEHYG